MVKDTKLYDLLQAPTNASDSELKKAFRRQAILHHPDKNKDDPTAHARFQEINHAYEILSNIETRTVYDRTGSVDAKGGEYTSFHAEDFMQEFFSMGGNNGFNFDFSGGMHSRSTRRSKKRNVTQPYEVTLEDVYTGKRVRMMLSHDVTCDTCYGRGTKADAKPRKCPTCNGQGFVLCQKALGPGIITQQPMDCPECLGATQIIREKDKCKKCKGMKVVQKKEKVDIHIEKGMKTGNKIVLKGMADQSNADPDDGPGDVILKIRVKPHEKFVRKGDHLKIQVQISLLEALSGFSKLILTHLDGRGIQLTTIPGKVIRPGDVYRIRGEGMPIQGRRGVKGDLFVQWDIVFPQDGFINGTNMAQFDQMFKNASKVTMIPEPDLVETVAAEESNVEAFDIDMNGSLYDSLDDDYDESSDELEDEEDSQCAHQ